MGRTGRLFVTRRQARLPPVEKQGGVKQRVGSVRRERDAGEDVGVSDGDGGKSPQAGPARPGVANDAEPAPAGPMPNATGPAGLLPAGLRDELPPQAGLEAMIGERVTAILAGHGYRRVKPPLLEFEESLLDGTGAALGPQMFRLMDPVSQRMMGLRTDTTVQVVRIAKTRLSTAPRPLRLSYAGQVLRVRGSQLRPERQFGQVGAELIGSGDRAADLEVALLAVESLHALGVRKVALNLCDPRLVPTVCAGLGMAAEAAAAARYALDRKDGAALARAAGEAAAALKPYLRVGTADVVVARLRAAGPPPAAGLLIDALDHIALELQAAAPELLVTIDPGEYRGFEYHNGPAFALFADGVRGELGRGGRYGGHNGVEDATGFTLYMDSLLRAVEPSPEPPSLFLPYGLPQAEGRELRAQGWVTLAALSPGQDPVAEARRLGCSHVLRDGQPVSLDEAAGD